MLTVELLLISQALIFPGILNATGCTIGCLVSFCMLKPVSGAMQVELTLPVTTTPGGIVSVSAEVKLAAVVGLVLVMVMASVETPPAVIVAGLKALPSVTT
jgi:hypothetical protein